MGEADGAEEEAVKLARVKCHHSFGSDVSIKSVL